MKHESLGRIFLVTFANCFQQYFWYLADLPRLRWPWQGIYKHLSNHMIPRPSLRNLVWGCRWYGQPPNSSISACQRTTVYSYIRLLSSDGNVTCSRSRASHFLNMYSTRAMCYLLHVTSLIRLQIRFPCIPYTRPHFNIECIRKM